MAETSTFPKISIVVPVHNREDSIVRALRSALAQTNSRFELIVVDDASTDQTVAKIATVEDPRVRLVRSPHASQGRPGLVRNLGVRASRAPYILFLDSDDALRPTAIEELLSAIETPGIGMAWGYKALWRQEKMISVAFVSSLNKVRPENRVAVLLGWTPGTGGLCFRREVFDSLGGFDSSLGPFEDLDFTLRFGLEGKWGFKALSTITYDCHVSHGISVTFTPQYALCLERFFQKHTSQFEKFSDSRQAMLYRLAVTHYFVGDPVKGRSYFEKVLERGKLTPKQRVIRWLLESGLLPLVRWASYLNGRAHEVRRRRQLDQKKAA